MIDQRPRLVDEMITTLFNDLDLHGELRESKIDRRDRYGRWKILLSKVLEPKSAPIPGIGTRREADVKAFLQKYPEVKTLIQQAKDLAKTLLPSPFETVLRVSEDPEFCQVCVETRALAMSFVLPERNDPVQEVFENAFQELWLASPIDLKIKSLFFVQTEVSP